MPRQSRISWLNYPHLVIAQANGGTQLFKHNDDYAYYLSLLRQLVRDRFVKVFAFCLMPHELRLVIEPNRLKLSRIMQRLHGKHSAYMNKEYKRGGHLFRGRFKSILFNPSDLLSVVRSVHLWPVRQGVYRRPELYPYASHGAYVGQANADFLAMAEVLNLFNGDANAKKRAFSRYVEASALDPDNFGLTELVPGVGGVTRENSSDLLKRAAEPYDLRRKPSLKSLSERVSLLLSISLEQLMSISRRQDFVMARRLLATIAVLGAERSVTEVARFLARDKAQISRLVSQGIDLLDTNEAFILMFEALKTNKNPPII